MTVEKVWDARVGGEIPPNPETAGSPRNSFVIASYINGGKALNGLGLTGLPNHQTLNAVR